MSAKIYTPLPLATNWGGLALRGAVALLFGLLTLFMPGLTLVYLVTLFGVFALMDGIFSVVVGFRAPEGRQRWVPYLSVGIIGILAGIMAFLYPGLTAVTLVYLIAAWAVVSGVTQITAAIHLRKHVQGEWLLILGGALSVLFGLFLFFNPGAGALGLVVWIGSFAIVLGALLLMLAFRLRGWERSQQGTGGVLRTA